MHNHHDVYLINNLIFIMVRVLIILYMAPIIGNNVVSNKIKFSLSILISLLIISVIPCTEITLFSYYGIIVLIEQVFIGVSIGLSMQLILFFVFVAGEIITLQIDLHNIIDFDYDLFCNISIITKIFYVFLFLLFLSYNGHLYIIIFITKSFYIFPLSKIEFDINFVFHFVQILYISFLYGCIVILPIIIILFVIKILIGMMFRLSIQISSFFTGYILFYFVFLFFLFHTNTIFFYSLIYILKQVINLFFCTFN